MSSNAQTEENLDDDEDDDIENKSILMAQSINYNRGSTPTSQKK